MERVRLTKRVTATGTQVVVKHRPGGEQHDQDRHGRRGIGSVALRTLLTRLDYDEGREPDRPRYDDMDLTSLVTEAARRYGGADRLRTALEALGDLDTEGGENVRQEDVPAEALPEDELTRVAQRFRNPPKDTECVMCGRPADVKMHWNDGAAATGACRKHERSAASIRRVLGQQGQLGQQDRDGGSYRPEAR